MTLVAHLIDNIYDTQKNNPHRIWAPEGVCLDEHARLWIADSNNDRVVGVKKGQKDIIVRTRRHPGHIAVQGDLLAIATSFSGGGGEIRDLNSGKVRELYSAYDVCTDGKKIFVLAGWHQDAVLQEVTLEKTVEIMQANKLGFKTHQYKAACNSIGFVTASNLHLLMLADIGTRYYNWGILFGTDYRIFDFAVGLKPKSIMKLGSDEHSLSHMCIDGENLFLLWQHNNDNYLTVTDTGKQGKERVAFAEKDLLNAESSSGVKYNTPYSVSVRTIGDRTLMALVAAYHVGLYELQKAK